MLPYRIISLSLIFQIFYAKDCVSRWNGNGLMLVCIPHTHTNNGRKGMQNTITIRDVIQIIFPPKKSFISIFYAFAIRHRLSTIGVHQIRILYEFFTYLHNNYDAVDLYAVVRHNFNSSSSSSLRWGCIKTAHSKKGLVEQVNGENFCVRVSRIFPMDRQKSSDEHVIRTDSTVGTGKLDMTLVSVCGFIRTVQCSFDPIWMIADLARCTRDGWSCTNSGHDMRMYKWIRRQFCDGHAHTHT